MSPLGDDQLTNRKGKKEMKTPYKYQVNFEKTFTDGILKGHHYSMNHVRFAEKANAIVFVELCDGKTERSEERRVGQECR